MAPLPASCRRNPHGKGGNVDRLRKGKSLTQGQSLDSKDGRYRLTVGADGNLVLRRAEGVVWSSQTAGNPGARLTMQADGNLVLYSPAHAPLWATDTWDHPGAWVKLQTDGNLVVYARGGRTALWATNPLLKTRRVEGFLPSKSGLPFRNDYPAGTEWAIVDFPIVGELLTADAGNGLCGGFGFTVVDIFRVRPRLELPPDAERPPAGSPRFEYLHHRLLDTFDGAVPFGTILKILSWIETPSHDAFLRRGLGHMMVSDEWPNVRRDIDRDRPSPIVLVGPPQAGLGDVSEIKKALANSHQVVAYGYDVVPSAVVIYVYDPNNPSEDNATLTVSLAHPEQPVVTANLGREVRGFFRSHYTRRNPRPTWS
jgi:hypothetical protein